MVLMRDKTLPRLDWATGTITSVIAGRDKLVRRVVVQPHKRPGQNVAPSPKEREIHDLVLLKSFQMMDNPLPDSTSIPKAPVNATIMMTTQKQIDKELYVFDPEDGHPTGSILRTTNISECSIQQPKQLIDKLTLEESDFLQNSATALLNQIQLIKKSEQPLKEVSNNLGDRSAPGENENDQDGDIEIFSIFTPYNLIYPNLTLPNLKHSIKNLLQIPPKRYQKKEQKRLYLLNGKRYQFLDDIFSPYILRIY